MSPAGYPSICQTVRFDRVARPGPIAGERIDWITVPTPNVRLQRIVFGRSFRG